MFCHSGARPPAEGRGSKNSESSNLGRWLLDSGFASAEPVIGPAKGRTRWLRRPRMTNLKFGAHMIGFMESLNQVCKGFGQATGKMPAYSYAGKESEGEIRVRFSDFCQPPAQ
jgi:hypothetical protein